jgi:uncharacterized membrane protein
LRRTLVLPVILCSKKEKINNQTPQAKTGAIQMKFINYIQSIINVDTYGLIGLLLFFIIFIGISFWALKADKKLMDKINRIPLDN